MVNKKSKNLNTSKYYKYEPDYAVPPGETLLETIEQIGMSQAELAERTGRPKKTINEIINGKTAITSETARQLERVLGIPSSFWNNLERNYREKLAEIEESEKLVSHVEWLKEIPIKTMIEYGWIKGCNDKIEQLQEVLNYFGVATVEAWKEVWKKVLGDPKFAFRQSAAFTSETGAVAAWIRKGQLESQRIKCQPLKSSVFRKALEEIRGLTNDSPKVFMPKVTELCANAGVAVVFVPELPKSRVSGAAYWLNSEKAVIQLSSRYKTNDHFWFTFFHEAGHILQNIKKKMFLEYVDDNQKDEEEANRFASETLIPSSLYKVFSKQSPFSAHTVEKFAQQLGIAPGIVVGRLQHDKLIPYSHLNSLKNYFEWSIPK